MRELTIYNYSKRPEQVLGRIRLEGTSASLTGFSAKMEAELQKGLVDPATRARITPAMGEAFFDRVLLQYSGAYIRAVERTYADVLRHG